MSLVEARRTRIRWIKENIMDLEKIDPLFDRYNIARIRDRLLESGLYPAHQRWIDETSVASMVLAAQGKPTRRN